MKSLMIPLMEEYKRLIDVEEQFEEWQRNNPEESRWRYNGQRVSKARFERIGVMIRQTMVDFERNHKPH